MLKYSFKVTAGKNMLDGIAKTDDMGLTELGVQVAMKGYSLSYPFMLEKGAKYAISGWKGAEARLAQYFADGIPGAFHYITAGNIFTVKTGEVAYLRISTKTDAWDELRIFKFHDATPNYGDDLALSVEKEDDAQYFRRSIDGDLTFYGEDYALLDSSGIETDFIVELSMNGEPYCYGMFHKTDAEWNADDKTCKVQPEPYDEYTELLDNIDVEQDLVRLKPSISQAAICKRPILQMYMFGSGKVTNIVGGAYWESDATETETDRAAFEQKYGLTASVYLTAKVFNSAEYPDANGYYCGFVTEYPSLGTFSADLYNAKNYRIQIRYHEGGSYNLSLISPDKETLSDVQNIAISPDFLPSTYDLSDGFIKVTIYEFSYLYARLILNQDVFTNTDGTTSEAKAIPSDDFCSSNNYKYYIPYNITSNLTVSIEATDEPTEWGLNGDDKYLADPANSDWIPVCPSVWSNTAYWYDYSNADRTAESLNRNFYTLRHAYAIGDAIKTLLAELAPSVRHESTAEYSQFLYGDANPITGGSFSLLIAPKTNVTKGAYDQEARKGVVTLESLLNMLRDTFQCYWHIEDGKLKIEHISYYQNGSSYDGKKTVGADTTKMLNPRNGKTWAFATSKWSYDKPEMPERYALAWQDETTENFAGEAEMLSRYVERGQTEEKTMSDFSADIDYMLANPDSVGEDGFAAIAVSGFKPVAYNYSYWGYKIDPSTGNPVADNDYFITRSQSLQSDKGFEVVQDFRYRLSHAYDGAWYDAAGNFLLGFSPTAAQQGGEVVLTAPAKARYYVASFKKSEQSTSTFTPLNYSAVIGEIVNTGIMAQNNIMAFPFLLQYFWRSSFPARRYRLNGIVQEADYITPLKSQETAFPSMEDPSPYELVRTPLGEGNVESYTITLLSRMVNMKLLYETDE